MALLGTVVSPAGVAADRGKKDGPRIGPASESENARADEAAAEGGRAAGGRIIGGYWVSNGSFPFVGALLDTRRGTTTYRQQFCGGTLIDAYHVLTAAHCVSGSFAASNPTNLDVLLGQTSLSGTGGVRRDVSRVFVHPWYTGSGLILYDSAVLRLSRPVTTIRPVALPAAGSQIGLSPANQQLTVAGWGKVQQGGDYTSTHADWLKAATVPVTSASWCQQRVGLTAAQYGAVVCAGWLDGGNNSCNGDSGGPLFGWTGTAYVQVGTVTGAFNGCAAAGSPTWCARVANPHIRAFIDAARSAQSRSGITRALEAVDARQDPGTRLEPTDGGDDRAHADLQRPEDARKRDRDRTDRRQGEGGQAENRDPEEGGRPADAPDRPSRG